MMRIAMAAALTALFMAHPAGAEGGKLTREQLTQAQQRIKSVTGAESRLTNGSGPLGTCVDDSECPAGWICVGMGLCVPEKTAVDFRSQLPELLAPRKK